MAIGQKPASPPPPPVLVARLPIQDRNRKVFGYELAFQALPNAEDDDGTEAQRAGARVISDSLLAIGLDTLVAGHKAFVSVGRQLLLEGVPSVLPPKRVVIDLSADIEADAEVLAACQQLRQNGYEIAITDFVLNEWTKDLVPLASFLKVRALDVNGQPPVNGANGKPAAALIATGVETMDTFEQATKAGFSYFQGFFFGKPTVMQGRGVPAQHMVHLRLLRALNDPDLSVHALEDLVKHDAALCYRLLRTVNSASFGLRNTVKSIREALLLLGRDTVRRWAALWSMAAIGEGAHSELTAISTVRARCCETLGAKAGGEELAGRAFFVGMCSLMDIILARPMESVLGDLPLDQESRLALMGNDNQLNRLLECVVAYERAEFDRCLPLAYSAGVDPALLPKAYAEGLQWSREMQQK